MNAMTQQEQFARDGKIQDRAALVVSPAYGALAGMGVGGLLKGKKGVTKKAALVGAGATMGARLMLRKSIAKDRAIAETEPGQKGANAFVRASGKNAAPLLGAYLVAGGSVLGKRPLRAAAAKAGEVVRKTTGKVKAMNRLMRMKKGGDSAQKGVTRTKGVPKGKGPILDAETGERYPALTSRRANLSELAAECRELKLRDEEGEFVPSSAGAADPRLHAAAYELPVPKKEKKRGAAGALERLLLRKGTLSRS